MRVFKRGQTYYCYVYVDGVRVQRSTRCHDKQAAETVARQFERDGADPVHAATHAATLSQAVRLLISTRKEQVVAGRRSSATVDFYRAKAGHLIRHFEGDPSTPDHRPFPLRMLSAAEVDKYISARREQEAGDHTISKELITLRAALKLAKRAGIWKGDLGELLPVAFSPAYKPRERSLTREEMTKLLGELTPDRAARVAFIVGSSASWSESDTALRADVSLERVLLRGTKRATRWREVSLETEAQRSLLRFAVAQAEGVEGALFTPWSNVRRDLHAACVRARIPACSPNDLRRTFGHWLRHESIPLELIAPLMGHADTRMLERVYGKLSPDELSVQVRARLDAPKGAAPAMSLTVEAMVRVMSAASPEDLAARLAALAACITGASPRTDSATSTAPMALPAARQTTAKQAESGCPETESNRRHEDFQAPRSLWPTPRKHVENRGQFKKSTAPASPVHHPKRKAGR